jgi:hypothetical protein
VAWDQRPDRRTRRAFLHLPYSYVTAVWTGVTRDTRPNAAVTGIVPRRVESRMGAVLEALPIARFPSTLIEPDVPISGIRLVWGFPCQGVSRHFCLPLSFHSFVRPAPPSILPPRPHISVAVARSGGQGRRFFSAAEGSSLTDASTAAGCRRSGGWPRDDPRGACHWPRSNANHACIRLNPRS